MKTVKMTIDRVGPVLKSIQLLPNTRVMVGIPSTEAERSPDPADGEVSPLNNAQIGYIMENGSPSANIPARPHLVPGVKESAPKWSTYLGAAAKAALDGNDTTAGKNFHAAGLTAQNAVRAKITEGVPPELSPRTLAKRRAKGRTGEKPLVDTGEYRRAQSYVIVKGRRNASS